jgi:hypothetical protein
VLGSTIKNGTVVSRTNNKTNVSHTAVPCFKSKIGPEGLDKDHRSGVLTNLRAARRSV